MALLPRWLHLHGYTCYGYTYYGYTPRKPVAPGSADDRYSYCCYNITVPHVQEPRGRWATKRVLVTVG
eukprot:scaffold124803_cov33-Phaeocystis_antarctica.AAC.1